MGPQERAQIFHQKHESKIIDGRRAEAKAQIEVAGLRINRLHQHCADTHGIGSLLRPQERILQQRGAETFALLGAANCQPAKHHDTDGMRGKSVADAPGCFGATYAASSQGMITIDDAIAPVCDIYSDRIVGGVRPCEAL